MWNFDCTTIEFAATYHIPVKGDATEEVGIMTNDTHGSAVGAEAIEDKILLKQLPVAPNSGLTFCAHQQAPPCQGAALVASSPRWPQPPHLPLQEGLGYRWTPGPLGIVAQVGFGIHLARP